MCHGTRTAPERTYLRNAENPGKIAENRISDIKPVLSCCGKRANPRLTLAVPKIAMRLEAARDFDRGELSALAFSATGSARRKALVPRVGSGRERDREVESDTDREVESDTSMKKSTGQKPCGFFGRSDGIRSYHFVPFMHTYTMLFSKILILEMQFAHYVAGAQVTQRCRRQSA